MTIDDDDDDDAINQWQESSDLNRVDIDETKKNNPRSDLWNEKKKRKKMKNRLVINCGFVYTKQKSNVPYAIN